MLVMQPPPTPLRNQNAVPMIALFHGSRPDLSPSFSALWGQFVILSALVLYLGFSSFIQHVYCVSEPVIGTEGTVIKKKKKIHRICPVRAVCRANGWHGRILLTSGSEVREWEGGFAQKAFEGWVGMGVSIPEVSLPGKEACDGLNYSVHFFSFVQSCNLDEMSMRVRSRKRKTERRHFAWERGWRGFSVWRTVKDIV